MLDLLKCGDDANIKDVDKNVAEVFRPPPINVMESFSSPVHCPQGK
jgi:hypothetical protein